MAEAILQIEDLTVQIEDRIVLRNINLEIPEGAVTVLFGPNGSGKSTLIRTVMGFGGYTVIGGDILFKGKSIKSLNVAERAEIGLGIMFQHPPTICGVKLEQIGHFLTRDDESIQNLAESLNLTEMLSRELNGGLSGGEIKRSELFQIILQKPSLFLLDEPESGVDIENISIMGKILNSFLNREKVAGLIITHTGYILDYIKADSGFVMIDGELHCMGISPKKIFNRIKEVGYDKCKECHEGL